MVLETAAGRLTRIDRGAPPRVLASGLSSPVGLARRGTGWVVAEPDGGRVVAVHEGAPLTLVASQLAQPSGLAVTLGGQIWVAEVGTGSLLRIETDGARSVIVDRLALSRPRGLHPHPVAMAIDADGRLLIAPPGDGSVLAVATP